mmetsp:Transcript_27303/g.32004  ORF Transcript_27303/g.32004 Transcript_27303/m.32004 type:complete len:83 (+) Transcript_27303:156-404(+)
MSATFMVCSYTLMRQKGFRVTPVAASKLAGLGGVFLTGMMGYSFGSSVATASMGNSMQYYYLIGNKGSIVSGSAPFDAPQAQ